LSDDRLLIPTHPLQAQWLLHQDYIQQRIAGGEIEDIGPLGTKFTPTSSVRTLYSEQLDFMVKLSIPVKVTNSMRINMHHELEAGIVVANLLRTTEFSHKYPRFQTIDDPAYISLALPEREESGFELIIRENPFSACQPNADQLSVISVAALTQDSITPEQPSRLASLIQQLADNLQEKEQQEKQQQAKEQQLPITDVAMLWFEHYWQCAIEPAIRLYDEHGIALEAHQQNSLLDVSEGLPSRYFYRDNQGFYLSKAHQADLMAQEPRLANTPELFYDDEMILNRFSYYLIVNQLFSVINRLGIDQLLPEQRALEMSVSWLANLATQLNGQGKALIDALLSQRDIAFKGNLLTRIHDVDELQADQELAVYTKVKNPFRAIAFAQGVIDETTEEQHHTVSTAPHTLHLNALISASEQASLARLSEVSENTEVQRESA
jgi:siderophore synthetase component